MIDVVIFAVIAGILVFKLWSQLGKRGDGESEGIDDLIQGLRSRDRAHDNAHDNGHGGTRRDETPTKGQRKGHGRGKIHDAEFSEVMESDTPPDFSAYGDAAKGLQAIAAAEPSFDPEAFLKGAEVAFEMILDDFASGNKKGLQELLGEKLYRDFEAAIDKRNEKEERLSDTLVGIDKIAITDARLTRRRVASITVSVHSQQVLARYDARGKLIEGDPQTTINKIDIWVFERAIKSRDPNWLLMATDG